MTQRCTTGRDRDDKLGRTRAILSQGHFSDVDVIVQDQVFHCHRYVLAQHSQYFFSQLIDIQTDASQTVQGDDAPRIHNEAASVHVDEPNPTDTNSSTETENETSLAKIKTEETSFENPGSVSTAESVKAVTNLSRDASAETKSPNEPRLYPALEPQETASSSKKAGPAPIKRTLKLDFLSPQTFSAILEAIYYSIQDPTPSSDVLDIYKASQRLQISGLQKRCQRSIIQLILSRKLDAAEIFLDAHMADSPDILHSALEVLLTDFGAGASKADWFLNLPREKLRSVLTDPRLNVRHEDEVYRALIDWYEHDPWGRHGDMTTGLTLIRLANLSKRVLVEEVLVLPFCYDYENPSVGWDGSEGVLKRRVQQALAYHLLPDRRHDELLDIADFRPSQDWERVLLVLGDQSSQLYAFSFARRAWFRLAPPPAGLGLGVASCTHQDDLYLTGGDAANTACYRYRAEVNAWMQLSHLKEGRRSHGCVAVGDCVYVLGGKDDSKSFRRDTLNSVEVLRLKVKGQGWKVTEGALVIPVRSMTTVVHQDCIYVMGGRTNGFQQTVDAIQCFDTRTQQCSLVGYLPAPSCLARPFLANKVIYILEPSGNVFRFQPTKITGDTFTRIPAETKQERPTPTEQRRRDSKEKQLNGEAKIYRDVEKEPSPGIQDSWSSENARRMRASQENINGEAEKSPNAEAEINPGVQNSPSSEKSLRKETESGPGVQSSSSSENSFCVVRSESDNDGVMVSADKFVTKVGTVANLSWKWFGAAKGSDGTLYVVAGERPSSFDGSAAADSESVSGCGGEGIKDVFRRVRFIRPESMVMCYVSAHMCIPKCFLVEKIV